MIAMMGAAGFRFKLDGEMFHTPASSPIWITDSGRLVQQMTDLKTLYEEDTVAWADNQAAALRAAARRGSNLPLDWENLAEEIEDLSKSIKRSLRSHVRNVIEHLIKLEHSAAQSPRENWRESIQNARSEIEVLIEDSPSLRPQLGGIIKRETQRGAKLAIEKLDRRGELGPLLAQALKSKSYVELFAYTPDQILGDWFPPELDGGPQRGK